MSNGLPACIRLADDVDTGSDAGSLYECRICGARIRGPHRARDHECGRRGLTPCPACGAWDALPDRATDLRLVETCRGCGRLRQRGRRR